MKGQRGKEVKLNPFSTSAVDGIDGQVQAPSISPSGKKTTPYKQEAR